MSEERRIVKRHNTREILDRSLIFNESGCYLLVLSKEQIEIVRACIQYARRRINWLDEDVDGVLYYLPDDEDYDEIIATVDDLEDRLMDICSLDDLLDALSCVCTSLQNYVTSQVGSTSSEYLSTLQSAGSLVYEPIENETQVDVDACAQAQCLWNMIYEYVSEIAIPLANVSFDVLVVASLGFLVNIAGIANVLVQLGITAATIQAVLKGIMDSNGQSILNWLYSDKQDIVCAIYDAITSDPVDTSIIDAEVDASDIPALSKSFLKLAFSWLLPTAKLARYTDWAIDRFVAGYCDSCGSGYDEVWHGVPCPFVPPESEEIDGVDCYLNAVAIDFCKPARTVPGWAIQAGTVDFGVWASGYAGVGMELNVVLKDHSDVTIDSTSFTVTSSEDTQFFSDTFTVPYGDAGACFYFYASGNGSGRLLQVGATNTPS